VRVGCGGVAKTIAPLFLLPTSLYQKIIILNMRTSLCKNLTKSQIIGTDTIDGILLKIKNGYTKQQVELARSYGKGTPEYDQIKVMIPTFTPHGEFSGTRKISNLIQLSGFIYLDFDGYTNKQRIAQLPFVYACWESLSAQGLGCLVQVDNLTTDNFLSVWNYLSNNLKQLQIELDSACKDLSRQNVISYDPNLVINTNCTILDAIRIHASYTSSTSKQNHYCTLSTGILPTYSSATSTINPNLDFESSTTVNDVSFGDINISHIPQEKIVYKTTLSDYGGLDYVIIEEGIPFRSAYLPKQIKDGDRHKWLCSHIITLIFNNPDISFKRLLNELLGENSLHCCPPMDTSKVISLTKWFFEKHSQGCLFIKAKHKKIWFNPSNTFTRKEKRIIVGKEVGALRRKNTLNRIQKAYDELKVNHKRVTQKMVKELSEVSLRTIKKRWAEISR